MKARDEFSSVQGAALECAGRGWQVFPAKIDGGTKKGCIAGKANGGARWGATIDPDTIRQYWTQFPDALLGIATGPDSGLFVIDADTAEDHAADGVSTLRQWIEENGDLPNTIEAQTPSGGWHLFFRWPGFEVKNSAGKLAPGIDIRAEGGMVIAPPSYRADKGAAYTWKNPPGLFEVADAPEWLLEKIKASQTKAAKEQTALPRDTGSDWANTALLDEIGNVLAAPAGQRNEALNKAAFNLGQIVAGGGLNESDVQARLQAAAEGIGLEPGEIAATIKSGLDAGQQTPRGPKEGFDMPPRFLQSQPQAQRFPFVAVGDLRYKPPEFLVGGLIETETLGLVFGDPGCGKSFLAVDLALSVASGADFHGQEVKQGAVFYIAGEGHNGLVRRFHAWARHRARSLEGVPMFKSERAAQFLDGSSAQAVAQAVNDLAALHGEPALIVVDTLARNFGAGDENSTEQMGAFVAAMDDLRAHWPGAVVLIVHHSGHAEKQRARGSMALKGALDFEYRLEKDGPALTLSNTKMKDAEPPADMFFALTSIDLDGGAQSAVLTETQAPERKSKMTTAQRLGVSSYSEAAKEHGIFEDDGFKGVHLDHWRDEFYRVHTGDTTEAKKKAFQRARNSLCEDGRFTVSDDIYLITDPALRLAIVMGRDNRDKAGHVPARPGTDGTNA